MYSRCAAALLAALVLSVAGADASAASTPTTVASAFYTWVFHGSGDQHGARPYLTPLFYADLREATRVEKLTHDEVLDSNPYIDAQIEADSYTLGRPTIVGTTARVPVHIVYKRYKKGNTLTLVERKTAVGWLIEDILDHTGASTDARIRHNVASTLKYYYARKAGH